MIIANPLYDVVFKYLMEDIDIAREILETILGEKILYLEVKPQETATEIGDDYIDVLTGKKIENVKEDFIELLTHDSFVIQVRGLPPQTKTKLERVLQVFNPKFKTKDEHKLDFTDKIEEPLVEKMVARLQRAISDEEMLRKMDVEDEIEQVIERANSQSAAEIAAQKIIIAEKDRAIANRDQAIADKDQTIEAERQKAEAERQKTADTNELIVRNLMLNTDLSDTQIATLTTFALDFVQKCRERLKTSQ